MPLAPRDSRPGPAAAVAVAVAVEQRDSVDRALVVALGRLPARERATLVLRDAFGWPAADVADLLGLSVAAVHSAHQRARAALLSPTSAGGPPPYVDPAVLAHCLDAYARDDAPAVADLLRHG